MRIAFLASEFVTEREIDGGLAHSLHKTCLSLIKLGHQPFVIVSSKTDGVIFHNGIEVHRVKINGRPAGFLDFITLRQFTRSLAWLHQSRKLNREAEKLHRQKPLDIIVYASHQAVGFFRFKKVPSVLRVNSHPRLWRTQDGKPHFSRDRKINVWLEITAAAKTDGLFAPSRVLAEIFRKETEKPVAVIETPVTADVPRMDDRLYRNSLAGQDYLLFFGTMKRLKGVDVIADILFELLEKYPRLIFVFIGGNTRYQPGMMMSDYLRQKAGPHHKRIIYFGQMPHEQLYPVLDNALAIILPSRIDNLPNTCLESMARKKVVVGTRGASFEQLIDDGINGFLCEPGNPADLLETIKKVLALTPEQKEIIGEKAAQRVNAAEPEKTVAQLVNFFQKIIEKMNYNVKMLKDEIP
ncbi:MAG: glycosyltransferase family 4 protein [Candidatus Ratteibacteria bacterium]|jgi:glycosyltransferase involved in cell wall biosynthesis